MFIPRLLSNGQPCCSRTLPDGRRAFPPNACQKCVDYAEARRPALKAAENYAPPDAYAADLAKMKEHR